MDKELQIMLPMKIINWESIPYSEDETMEDKIDMARGIDYKFERLREVER